MTQLHESASLPVATILVVEDDHDIRSILYDILMQAEYQVVTAHTGQAALDMLEQEVIDLVLLDVRLPDLDGYEVCRHIRQHTGSATPVIMLTALTQQPNVTRGFREGADDYVRKPFAPEELLLRIQGILRRYDGAREAEQEALALRNALQLIQRQLELTREEMQIEAILRHEFLHNVTTHMHALNGIAEATLRKLPPSAEREAVQQLRSRIRGAALVYEVSAALQTDPVEISTIVRTITSALKSMYRPWKRVVVNVQGAPVDLPLSIASPLALITNELITNCFKHAFPENRFGTIDVRYTADTHFELDVIDNGIGFEPDVPASGSGRTTITQLVGNLHGAVTWQSSAAGTRVRLRIPLQPDPPVSDNVKATALA